MEICSAVENRDAISRAVLTALPQWFGLPEALEAYVGHAASAPMLTALIAGRVVGYVSLADHFGRNCELHSMGVLPDLHRQGIGRALVAAAAAWARRHGYRYLTVKTLADTHPDPHYAVTRRFYTRVGFEPFEVLENLWAPDLPCLLMLKTLPA